MPNSATKTSKRHQEFSRKILILVILFLIIIGVVAGVIYATHSGQNKTPVVNKSKTNNASNPSHATSNSSNEASKGYSTSTNTPNTRNPTTSSPSTISAQIVNHSVSTTNLHIGTLVSGTANGSCYLTAIKTGQTELQLGASSVQLDVSSYDCGVFNVPTSKFPATGNWQITLTVTSNGVSASDTVTVGITNND